MEVKEYLKTLSINNEIEETEKDTYVINILDSNEYGRIYSKLENSDDLDIMYDNQVITEEGSSLIYESETEPYMLNLISDWEGGVYQLIINKI